MASILILAGGTTGRINTSRRLAQRLIDRGHRVAIASPTDISDRIGSFGGDFIELPPTSVPRGDTVARSVSKRALEFVGRLRQWKSVGIRREGKMAAYGLDELLRHVEERSVDLVVADLELPAHVMAVAGAGHRTILWTTMLSVWRRPHLPPLHTGIVPGDGLRGSFVGIEIAWWRFLAWKWIRSRRLWITRMGEDQRSVMRHVAAGTGFDWNRVNEYEWLLPFVFRDLPSLCFNAMELELPHDPHPHVRYVGPLLASESPSNPPERNGRPLVYAAFGAWHKGDDSQLIAAVIAAVAERPEWRLVVGLGGRSPSLDRSSLPANVEVLDWAPQNEILPRASVAVHHGGINTINECIAAGVPMVTLPFDYGDTPGAAARVAYHRIGVVMERHAATAEQLGGALDRLIEDESYRSRVRELARSFESYSDAAVHAIESVLP